MNCCQKKKEPKEKFVLIKNDNLTIKNLTETIGKEFGKNKKLKLYTNTGLEVRDDSDLYYLQLTDEKAIFFIKENEIFQNTNLLRLFNLEGKIGEVRINPYLGWVWKSLSWDK